MDDHGDGFTVSNSFRVDSSLKKVFKIYFYLFALGQF